MPILSIERSAPVDPGVEPGIRLSIVGYDAGAADLLAIRNANRETPRDTGYFDWRYRGQPAAHPPVVVLAEHWSGERIGALSMIPRDYLVDGARCSLGVLGDLSVSAPWRGRGLAGRMLRYAAESDVARGWAASVVLTDEAAAGSLERSGWRTVTRLRRYAATALSHRLAGLAAVFGAQTTPLTWEVTDTFDRRFDEFWHALDKTDAIIASRTANDLAWRYGRHPIDRYQCWIARQDALVGYVIFRLDGRRVAIDDLLCRDGERGAARLLRQFMPWAQSEAGVASWSIRVNERHRVTRALSRCGFFPRRDALRLMVHPLEDGRAARLLTPAAWWLTAGDKDV